LIVHTTSGPVRGFQAGDACAWKGVPFAKPPVGNLRFQAPQPPDRWTEPRDARSFGPASLQVENPVLSSVAGRGKLPQSEDCLYLNVWSKGADDKRRPVMVWIHGGSYLTGSGAIAWYDGAAFAKNGDVVVVTINYRLGALGYLYLGDLFGEAYAASGNLGLLDQIAALQWVHDNIAAFGGDPSRVTIFGESAGAGSVGALLAAPAAKGLFHRAILQSGSGRLGIRTRASATEVAKRVLDKVGVAPGDVSALHAVPAERFAEVGASLGAGLPFGPVMDGVVLPDFPPSALAAGAARDIPVMIGVNLDEYRLFTSYDPAWQSGDEAALRSKLQSLLGPLPDAIIDFYLNEVPGESTYDRLMKLGTYRVFVRGMLQTADLQAQQGAPVWAYRFDWKSTAFGGKLGACHALEIPFVFNNLHQLGVERFTGDAPDRQPIADHMHLAWIAFAHNGDPNDFTGVPQAATAGGGAVRGGAESGGAGVPSGAERSGAGLPSGAERSGAGLPSGAERSGAGLPHWPRYTLDKRELLVFGSDPHVEEDPYASERAAWERFVGEA
jgi:para-nitrobenzyl esterase